MRHVWAAFKDWQVWLHILIYMSIVGPGKCPAKASLRQSCTLMLRSVFGLALFLP